MEGCYRSPNLVSVGGIGECLRVLREEIGQLSAIEEFNGEAVSALTRQERHLLTRHELLHRHDSLTHTCHSHKASLNAHLNHLGLLIPTHTDDDERDVLSHRAHDGGELPQLQVR